MISHIFHFIISLSIIIILSLIICKNPKKIRIRFIIQLLTIEIFLGYYTLHSQIGLFIIQKICLFFQILLNCAMEGTNFVFGGLHEQGLAIFFLTVLCPIIFMSVLIGILKYTHILTFLIQLIGTVLSKISGMGKLESFNAISSLILGQSENFIIYKEIIKDISEPRIYTMAVTAMSTVSFSIVGAYLTMLIPKYVIAALILNIFNAFIILSLLNPYTIDKTQDSHILKFNQNHQNFFEIIGEYILIGLKITITVSAMLIGFIALISILNITFKKIINISFQEILSYICLPLAWIIDIPKNEITQISNIMATKLITNEFIAISDLQKISHTLSSRSIGIVSVFLVSFANFSSIGIIIGTIKTLDKNQGNIISRYGFRLLYSATLINMLSASIIGLIT